MRLSPLVFQKSPNFYIAEWRLARKEEQQAQTHFTAALENCPKDFDEYRAAKIELKKLKQQS